MLRMYSFLGILLIILPIIFSVYWINKKKSESGKIMILCTLMVFSGITIFFNERVIEVTINSVGTIKTAQKQAQTDANQIEEIKNRIIAQSATIDLVAKQANNAKELADDLLRKNAEASKQMESFNNSLQRGATAVKQLQDYSILTETTLAARGDDCKAYDQLLAWSKDESYALQNEAKLAVKSIMEQNEQIRFIPTIKWKENVNPNQLALNQLAYDFKIQETPQMRSALLSFIWKRDDIPKKERLAFLVEVIQTDPSIRVVDHAGGIFARATGDGFKDLAKEEHLRWWEENKDNPDL